MKMRFALRHMMAGESIALVEMDDELLAPEAGILDHNTMTLKPIKNGGNYSLFEVDDHTVNILKRLKKIYKDTTEKPTPLFSTTIGRMDALIEAVGMLFSDVEYAVIESKDDLAKLINPPNDYTPKTVKYSVMEDLIGKAIVEAKAAGRKPDDDEDVPSS